MEFDTPQAVPANFCPPLGSYGYRSGCGDFPDYAGVELLARRVSPTSEGSPEQTNPNGSPLGDKIQATIRKSMNAAEFRAFLEKAKASPDWFKHADNNGNPRTEEQARDACDRPALLLWLAHTLSFRNLFPSGTASLPRSAGLFAALDCADKLIGQISGAHSTVKTQFGAVAQAFHDAANAVHLGKALNRKRVMQAAVTLFETVVMNHPDQAVRRAAGFLIYILSRLPMPFLVVNDELKRRVANWPAHNGGSKYTDLNGISKEFWALKDQALCNAILQMIWP